MLWLFQDLFSKQKGFLEEELDYRKQALDQAYMVRGLLYSCLLLVGTWVVVLSW